jgi:tetratricopeptide (TPR) repeat protein
MRGKAAALDLRDSLAENTDRVIAAAVASNIASTAVINRGIDSLQSGMNTGFNRVSDGLDTLHSDINAGFTGIAYGMQDGFNAVSRHIGEMGAAMDMGFARLETVVQESANAICDKLDSISDTLKNPSLTQAREYYTRALANYNKGFYEEALAEVKECIRITKVDYIAWFLLGKVYLFGLGEFSNVIDLDAAINALTQAAKYITPDSRALAEAKLLASEILFFLALAKQNKAYDLSCGGDKESMKTILSEAARGFSQAYTYSNDMLEALYNAARCHAVMGNAAEACKCLGIIIRKDASYTLKAALDPDFSGIQAEFKQLIDELRREFLPSLQETFTRYRQLIAETKELGIAGIKPSEMLHSLGDAAVVPKDLPYLDMRELHRKLLVLIGKLEQKIASEKEAQRKYLANFEVKNGILIKYHGSDRNVKIPDSLGITSIGKEAFVRNKLTSVVIPDSVTSIGENAFRGNELTNVVIPDSVTSIAESAFSTNKLTSVVIPDSVTSIGEGAFSTNKLTSVVIPDSVTSIAERAFSSNQLTSVVIPDSVTSIGESAFFMNELTSVVIPDSVTSIGAYAFSSNYKLASITMPANIRIGMGFSILPSFDNDFASYYISQKQKAGVYTLSNDKWSRQKGEGEKEGCFITTAVCRTLGKGDRCGELAAFRRFRDTFMQSSAVMRAEVGEYYETAPRICARIDSLGGRRAGEVYGAIWKTYLKPSFDALNAGDHQKAHDIYKRMTLDLKKAYL